jgi:CheY-like chemotaxis protein
MSGKTAIATTDTPTKAVFSAAQMVGQGREIPYGRPKPSFKGYGDVTMALGCLAAMAVTICFAQMDSNYSSAARMTAAIRRVFQMSGSTGTAVDVRRTILVVESDESQRLIAKTALERYGYNVALADDGSQALTLLRNGGGRVALVVLDTHSSGAQTMQQLKGIRPSVPILVSEAAGEKLQAGAAGGIERPFSALPLAEAVQRTLGPVSL